MKIDQPIILAYNVSNLEITGNGIVDGQGSFWWAARKRKELKFGRPRLVEV